MPSKQRTSAAVAARPVVAPRLLKQVQVAAILGVTTRTVRRYMDTGRLPVVRIGTTVRVREDALAEFIARHEEPAISA